MVKTLDQLKGGSAGIDVEDDDFEFGEKSNDKTTEEIVTEDSVDKKKESTKKEEVEKEEVKEDAETEKESSDTETEKEVFEDTEKEEEGEKKEEEKKEGEDFFSSEFTQEEEKKPDAFDFKALANEFEIEAETKDDFKSKIAEKIEKAKQEFKIDNFSPDAQSVIKHLNENEGKIEDFFTNESIASLQSVLAMAPETKVLSVRVNELMSTGLKQEEATERAEEEIADLATRELKDMADKIDQDAKKLISQEVVHIVGEREKIVQKQKEVQQQKLQKEVTTLKNYVSSQEEFMGIKLTPTAKQNIVREIETGVFDSIADKTPEASKFAAYMIAKFGSKIVDNFVNKSAEKNREGYNAATEKHVNALHKTKDEAQGKKIGRTSQPKSGGNFESWDDSLFSDEEGN